MMAWAKMYTDDFTNARRLAWVRSRSQAWHRGEEWTLTFSEYCQFWSTEARWKLRGRTSGSLVMTRYDPQLPWNRENCCIIPRGEQLSANIRRKTGQNIDQCYKDAILYGK